MIDLSLEKQTQDFCASFTLPWPPADLLPNKRLHWTKKSKAAKQYRAACYYTAVQQRAAPWLFEGDIDLDLEFFPPDRRKRDDDGMIAAFKSGRDGLADALKIDDNRFKGRYKISSEIGGMIKVNCRVKKE
jgi:crossover junction endodeoxyribonuclease RusA